VQGKGQERINNMDLHSIFYFYRLGQDIKQAFYRIPAKFLNTDEQKEVLIVISFDLMFTLLNKSSFINLKNFNKIFQLSSSLFLSFKL
jgi:hypothetical protein